MTDFLEYLELVEDELTAPAELATVDPASARSGDLIDGGFTVVRRLGKGSSSDVLLVTRSGNAEVVVLKVTLDASHNRRLVAEGEALHRLHHANIVQWREPAIGELGYSVEAQNVLDHMGIHSVRELLAVDRVRFRYLKSVGDKVRKEIRGIAKRLAQIRPDLVAGAPTVLDTDASNSGIRSLDELANYLFPKRAAADERPDDDALAIYLGLETAETDVENERSPALRPTLGDAAQAAGIARPALTHAPALSRC